MRSMKPTRSATRSWRAPCVISGSRLMMRSASRSRSNFSRHICGPAKSQGRSPIRVDRGRALSLIRSLRDLAAASWRGRVGWKAVLRRAGPASETLHEGGHPPDRDHPAGGKAKARLCGYLPDCLIQQATGRVRLSAGASCASYYPGVLRSARRETRREATIQNLWR